MAGIEHGQGEQLHKKQDQVATDKDNRSEILFENIVTIEDEATQLKTDQEQEEEMLNKDNSDGQHEGTFVLCYESEEDELSLGIDTPEVHEEDILLFGDNLLKPLKRKKEKGKTKIKWTSTIRELKDFVQLVCQMRWHLENTPM